MRCQIEQGMGLIKHNPLIIGPLRVDLHEDGVGVTSPADPQGECRINGEGDVLFSARVEPSLKDMRVGPAPAPVIEGLRRCGSLIWYGVRGVSLIRSSASSNFSRSLP